VPTLPEATKYSANSPCFHAAGSGKFAHAVAGKGTRILFPRIWRTRPRRACKLNAVRKEPEASSARGASKHDAWATLFRVASKRQRDPLSKNRLSWDRISLRRIAGKSRRRRYQTFQWDDSSCGPPVTNAGHCGGRRGGRFAPAINRTGKDGKPKVKTVVSYPSR
jgi:hypothetical protein